MSDATARETLIFTIAQLLRGVRHVAVGALSPIPAAGAVLLRALEQRRGGEAVRISILGSPEHNFFIQCATVLIASAAPAPLLAFFPRDRPMRGPRNVHPVGAGVY